MTDRKVLCPEGHDTVVSRLDSEPDDTAIDVGGLGSSLYCTTCEEYI